MDVRKYKLTPTESLVHALEKFAKARDAAVAPTGGVVKEIERDETGRIAQVIERPLSLATPDDVQKATDAVTKTATMAIEAATGLVEEAKAQTAQQVTQQVTQKISEEARDIASAAIREAVDEIVAEAKDEAEAEDRWIEDFKRTEDESLDELEEEDADLFRSPAKEQRDAEKVVEAAVEAVSSSVLETQRAMEEVSKQIRHTTSLVDAIGYVLQECGNDYTKMRAFFKFWNAQPLTKDHPYEAEPRLRVLRFPDGEAGHMSNETSAEHKDDDPDLPTNQMALRPHHRRRQTVHDSEADAAMPADDIRLSVDAPRSENGSENYRDHKAPQADAVLLSERPYRVRKITKRRPKGWWSSID